MFISILEIKSNPQSLRWGNLGSEKLPSSVRVQMQHWLLVQSRFHHTCQWYKVQSPGNRSVWHRALLSEPAFTPGKSEAFHFVQGRKKTTKHCTVKFVHIHNTLSGSCYWFATAGHVTSHWAVRNACWQWQESRAYYSHAVMSTCMKEPAKWRNRGRL